VFLLQMITRWHCPTPWTLKHPDEFRDDLEAFKLSTWDARVNVADQKHRMPMLSLVYPQGTTSPGPRSRSYW